MMRWIVSTSIRFRFLVVALGGAMMLFGVTQLRSMPVDVFPEFAPPKVEIQTVTLGLTPEETETLVTVPLEQALAGIPALDVLRSKSVGQLSQIELIFDPARTTAPAVISLITAAHAVDDIHVEQPAIEEVIARFYEQHGAGEA